MHKRQKIGEYAEKLAADFLKSKGYKIIERNFRKPWGEIDIIAKSDDVVVFAEVKANSQEFRSKDFSPEARVDRGKLKKITRAAELYLEGKEIKWRVDIISVNFIKSENGTKITHFENVADSFY